MTLLQILGWSGFALLLCPALCVVPPALLYGIFSKRSFGWFYWIGTGTCVLTAAGFAWVCWWCWTTYAGCTGCVSGLVAIIFAFFTGAVCWLVTMIGILCIGVGRAKATLPGED